jgi:hypothetical protein
MKHFEEESMVGGKRDGAGASPHGLILWELEKLCALQCTDEDLAVFLGVTVRTIERRRQNPRNCGEVIDTSYIACQCFAGLRR